MKHRERGQVQSPANPDIASSTHDLKAMHAQPAVIPPEANRDKTGRLGHLPIVAGGLALTAAVIGGGYFATKGGDKPAPEAKEPVASAPIAPGEQAEQTQEAEPLASPEPISVEKYKTPEDAIAAIEEAELKFITGDVPSYNDYYMQDETLSMNDYDNMFLSTFFSSSINVEGNPLRERVLTLRDQYDSANSNLEFAYDKGTLATLSQYRVELDRIEVDLVEGHTITYRPFYKVNTEEIPEDYRDEAIDVVPDIDGRPVVTTLNQEDGNWVVVDSYNP